MDMIINSACALERGVSSFSEDEKQVWGKNMDEILVKITLYKCKFCLFFCSIPSGIFTHCQSIHPQRASLTLEQEKKDNVCKSVENDESNVSKTTVDVSKHSSCIEDLENLPPDSSCKSSSSMSFEHGYSKWLDENYQKEQQFLPTEQNDEVLLHNEERDTSIAEIIKEEVDQQSHGDDMGETGSPIKEMSNIISSDTTEDKKLYLCADCNLLFSDLDSCSKHLVEVHNVKQSVIDRSKIKSSACLKKHRKNSSKKPKGPIDCEICSKTFASSWTLRNHKNHVHNQVKKHKCKQCDYTAARAEMIKLHMRRHTGEKPFLCDSCPFNTADPNSLRRHKMIHAGRKPFNCNYCPYSVKKAAALLAHLKIRHPGMGQIFSCKSCDFETVSKLTFQRHICKSPEGNTDEDALEGGQFNTTDGSFLHSEQINETYLEIKPQEGSIKECGTNVKRTRTLVTIDGLDHPVTVDLGT